MLSAREDEHGIAVVKPDVLGRQAAFQGDPRDSRWALGFQGLAFDRRRRVHNHALAPGRHDDRLAAGGWQRGPSHRQRVNQSWGSRQRVGARRVHLANDSDVLGSVLFDAHRDLRVEVEPLGGELGPHFRLDLRESLTGRLNTPDKG